LAILAFESRGTKRIWILSGGVAVTALWYALAIFALLPGPAAVLRVIRIWITFTPWREARPTDAILANVPVGAEAVRICSQGVTVASRGKTFAVDTTVVSWTCLFFGIFIAVTSRGVDWAARVGQVIRGVGNAHLLDDTEVAGLFVQLSLAEVDHHVLAARRDLEEGHQDGGE